jgi:uncharacterized short protein YbdD (DUF466 family)
MRDRRTGGQVGYPGRGWWRRVVTPKAVRFGAAIRKIAGMPDYDAHVEHLRRCHRTALIPSERQFYEEFVRTRYGDGPTRCC